MTVTNHTVPVFGTVSVTKEITGATEGVLARATFPITVSCDSPAQGDDRRLQRDLRPDRQRHRHHPRLPVGTGCTVTEGTLPALGLVDDSYAWGTHPAAQDVTVDSANQTTAVTVTNQVVRAFGVAGHHQDHHAAQRRHRRRHHVHRNLELHHRRRDQERHLVTHRRRTGDPDRWRRPDPADLYLLGHRGRPTTPPNPGDPSYAWGAKTIGDPVTLTAPDPAGTRDGRQRGHPRHRHLLGHQERGGWGARHRVRRRRLHLQLHLLR